MVQFDHLLLCIHLLAMFAHIAKIRYVMSKTLIIRCFLLLYSFHSVVTSKLYLSSTDLILYVLFYCFNHSVYIVEDFIVSEAQFFVTHS